MHARWIGFENREDVIDRALSQLPEDVQSFVMRNVWFLFPESWQNAAAHSIYIPDGMLESRGGMSRAMIVYISPAMETEPAERLAYVVAHEVAHHWIGHHMFDADGQSDEQHEAAVDELAASWGFPRPAEN